MMHLNARGCELDVAFRYIVHVVAAKSPSFCCTGVVLYLSVILVSAVMTEKKNWSYCRTDLKIQSRIASNRLVSRSRSGGRYLIVHFVGLFPTYLFIASLSFLALLLATINTVSR